MSKTSTSTRTYRRWINAYPSIAKQLPLGETFQKNDLPPELQDHFDQITLDGLLEKVHDPGNNQDGAAWWRVSPDARSLVRELQDNHEGRLPCGHDGFKNLRESEYYECTVCERKFTREEIEDG